MYIGGAIGHAIFYSEFVWNRSEETKKRTMTFAANRWVLVGLSLLLFFFENYVCHNNRKNEHHTPCRELCSVGRYEYLKSYTLDN